MKCAMCGTGETEPGTTVLTLQRNGRAVAISGVPAEVCRQCGEGYTDGPVTSEVLRQAEAALKAGYGSRPLAYRRPAGSKAPPGRPPVRAPRKRPAAKSGALPRKKKKP